MLNLARGVNDRLLFQEESGIDECKISTKILTFKEKSVLNIKQKTKLEHVNLDKKTRENKTDLTNFSFHICSSHTGINWFRGKTLKVEFRVIALDFY